MNRKGFALEASLFVLLLIAVLVSVSVNGVISVTRTASVDYRNTRVGYAAEAGADAIMAQLHNALADGNLTDAELAAVVPPSVPGFTYDAVTVTRNGGTQVETVTDGPFAGLYSLTQDLEINSKVRDSLYNMSEVIVTAKAQAIPIFQFGIFFEKDLEITNGPSMTFVGWIHSNGNVYMSSNNAWYEKAITTPNQVIHNRKDANAPLNGVWIDDAYAVANNLNFDSRSHPVPADFRLMSNNAFDNRLKTNAYGVDSLSVPLPAGMPARAVMEPRLVTDVQAVRDAKFAWKADWYIKVDLSASFPNNFACNPVRMIRDSSALLPTGNQSTGDCGDIFRYTQDAFWEGRQGTMADVFQIDVNKLFNWTGSNPSGATTIMYIDFENVGTNYPVVRLWDGQDLGGPITFATERPIYIQGDYNSGGDWYPSAVVGDAITILSTDWDDDDHDLPGSGMLEEADDTEVYTAILAGHTPTPWDWFDGGGNAPYGGGVENYLRFIESWSGETATYYGSLVSRSESIYATAPWSYGLYYRAPARDWHFDMRFESPSDLPPGTPVVGNVIHTAFRPVY